MKRQIALELDMTLWVSDSRGAGCVEVFAEKVSSRAPLEKRRQLRACLETLQEEDELVISKPRLPRTDQGDSTSRRVFGPCPGLVQSQRTNA